MHPSPVKCAATGDAVIPTVSCESLCVASTTADELNRDCFCVAIEPDALRDSLATTMAAHGLTPGLAQPPAHPSFPVACSGWISISALLGPGSSSSIPTPAASSSTRY